MLYDCRISGFGVRSSAIRIKFKSNSRNNSRMIKLATNALNLKFLFVL